MREGLDQCGAVLVMVLEAHKAAGVLLSLTLVIMLCYFKIHEPALILNPNPNVVLLLALMFKLNHNPNVVLLIHDLTLIAANVLLIRIDNILKS